MLTVSTFRSTSASRCGLIDRHPHLPLHAGRSPARTRRARSAARTSDSSSRSIRLRRSSRSAFMTLPFQPAHVGAGASAPRPATAPCSAITLTSALPTTAASAQRPTCGDLLGRRDPEAQRQRQIGVRPDPRDQRLGVGRDLVARAGDAEPGDHVEKSAPQLRRRPNPRVRRRRAQQEDRIEPGADEPTRGTARPPRPADRAPARRRRRRPRAASTNSASPIRRTGLA